MTTYVVKGIWGVSGSRTYILRRTLYLVSCGLNSALPRPMGGVGRSRELSRVQRHVIITMQSHDSVWDYYVIHVDQIGWLPQGHPRIHPSMDGSMDYLHSWILGVRLSIITHLIKSYTSLIFIFRIYMFHCFWLALFSDACIDAVKCSEYAILSVLDQVALRIPLRMQIPGITDTCVHIGSFRNFPS